MKSICEMYPCKRPKMNNRKRINVIEKLPVPQQKALFKTIDAFLKSAQF